MGCDIHCYVEHRKLNPTDDYGKHWSSFGGRINPGRRYDIFERLAGVRGDVVNAITPPRGMPEDAGYQSRDDNWLWISYEGTESDGSVSPETAERYVRSSGSVYRGEVRPSTSTKHQGGVAVVSTNGAHVGKPQWVSHPDWHSHSWVTPDEWERAIGPETYDPEYRALLAAMRSLERDGREVRVVFWFDN